MRHTIELSEKGEASLRQLASHREARLRAELVLVRADDEEGESDAHDGMLTLGERRFAVDFENDPSLIRSTENVMGGDACVGNTRIPVWMLVGYKAAGYSDERILHNFPSLRPADLAAAWDFYAANTERVLAERRRHEEAD